MILTAKNLALYIDGEQVALAKSATLQVTVDIVENSSILTTGAAKTFIPGRYSWSINCDSLLSDEATTPINLTDAQIERREVLASFDITTHALRGSALISSAEVSGSAGQLITYRASLTGTGDLTKIKK